MVTAFEIPPCLELASYVRCYALRKFDTHGSDLIKPWHATHEISMVVFFESLPVHLVDQQTGEITKGKPAGILGLSTHYIGNMTFNGCYLFFEIRFKPNGFNRLFRLAANELINHIFSVDDIFDNTVVSFLARLQEASDLNEMATISNAFLVHRLRNQKTISYEDRITAVSNLIVKNENHLAVDQLAAYANMSIRNFERRFVEQVGIPPRLFCSITRFNYALNLKIKHPNVHWSSIAYECGYFDQMHFIKDFRKFSGSSPSVFLRDTPLPIEKFEPVVSK